MVTLHTYIATIALCQNFHGGTSMAWSFIRTWTMTPLNFTYEMHFRPKNEGISSRFCRYNFPVNLRCPPERGNWPFRARLIFRLWRTIINVLVLRVLCTVRLTVSLTVLEYLVLFREGEIFTFVPVVHSNSFHHICGSGKWEKDHARILEGVDHYCGGMETWDFRCRSSPDSQTDRILLV